MSEPTPTVDMTEGIERRKTEWRRLDEAINAYMEEYEYGETGYSPSKMELALIRDCLQGLIADEDFMRAIAQVYPVRARHAAIQRTLAAQRTALLYYYEKLQPMQPFEEWVREIGK